VVPNAIRYSKAEEICCGLLQISLTGFASDGGVKPVRWDSNQEYSSCELHEV